jgi:hypothetical protein
MKKKKKKQAAPFWTFGLMMPCFFNLIFCYSSVTWNLANFTKFCLLSKAPDKKKQKNKKKTQFYFWGENFEMHWAIGLLEKEGDCSAHWTLHSVLLNQWASPGFSQRLLVRRFCLRVQGQGHNVLEGFFPLVDLSHHLGQCVLFWLVWKREKKTEGLLKYRSFHCHTKVSCCIYN